MDSAHPQDSFETGLSPEALDALYDNRARVPEHQVHLKAWAHHSEQARQSLRCLLDVKYGSGLGDTLDIFYPSKTPTGNTQAMAPVVVFLHGGYWRSLDKSDHSFVAPALCARGVCVVVLNYDLCPGTPEQPVRIPGIVAQVARGMTWLHQHLAAHHADARRMVVVGHSAGGQLAAMMLQPQIAGAAYPARAGLVQQAVSISGVFDLAPLMQAPSFQASLQLDAQQIALASPARLPAPAQGMLRALVGGAETAEFLRQNELIQQRWGAEHVPLARAVPGLNHFSILDTLADPNSELFGQVMEAVQATARESPSAG